MLAGDQCYIDYFRCITCDTPLESDLKLLLLGNGSLISNQYTYECSVCNNKIKDLVIFTGDQVHCATCFKCRNCKKRIKNLKWSRTSQGIFCMNCRDSLMQEHRRKASAKGNRREQKTAQSLLNPQDPLSRALPALSPEAIQGSISNAITLASTSRSAKLPISRFNALPLHQYIEEGPQ